jgi:hypothetical protein
VRAAGETLQWPASDNHHPFISMDLICNDSADCTSRKEFEYLGMRGVNLQVVRAFCAVFGLFCICSARLPAQDSPTVPVQTPAATVETAQIGVGASGKHWHRKFDRAGVVFVSNGISLDHQEYLALGGAGFLLGDGRLNYGRENIIESYYTLHVWRGIYPSFGLQHINNPGYNRDRGPVVVPTLRLHVEF